MSKCDTIVPLIFAMKKRKDCVHTAAETIKKLYDLSIPELVEQVFTHTRHSHTELVLLCLAVNNLLVLN